MPPRSQPNRHRKPRSKHRCDTCCGRKVPERGQHVPARAPGGDKAAGDRPQDREQHVEIPQRDVFCRHRTVQAIRIGPHSSARRAVVRGWRMSLGGTFHRRRVTARQRRHLPLIRLLRQAKARTPRLRRRANRYGHLFDGLNAPHEAAAPDNVRRLGAAPRSSAGGACNVLTGDAPGALSGAAGATLAPRLVALPNPTRESRQAIQPGRDFVVLGSVGEP